MPFMFLNKDYPLTTRVIDSDDLRRFACEIDGLADALDRENAAAAPSYIYEAFAAFLTYQDDSDMSTT